MNNPVSYRATSSKANRANGGLSKQYSEQFLALTYIRRAILQVKALCNDFKFISTVFQVELERP